MIDVRFPDHPQIITFGKNFTEATHHAHEALNATLETDFDREKNYLEILQK
ncbi:MAG: hypothetical protein KBD63_04510 [Bacteriovoracaceae bacterium]|nr:hypothetical protein [Bacteriovoracaceae bacterium]